MDEPRHLQGFNVRAMNEDATIAEAESAADMAEIRALFVEYQQWLGVDLCFKDFAEEIDNLPGKYAPPAGRGCRRGRTSGGLCPHAPGYAPTP